MGMLLKGIISFPQLFEPKVGAAGGDPKFNVALLFPSTDPGLVEAYAEFEKAKLDGFPSGMNASQSVCLAPYDDKYRGKEYYDAKFSGWWVLGLSAPADNPPSVVDMNRKPLIDRSKVFSGAVAYVACAISSYSKGSGGVGGWLNGLMITDEAPPMGRLDGKPTNDQMFAGAPGGAPGGVPSAPVPSAAPNAPVAPSAAPPAPTAPVAPAPPAPVAPAAPAPPVHQMTAKANGVPYETFINDPAWSDALLIEHGYMLAAGTPLAFTA